MMEKTITVLGGDLRQVRLAELLIADGQDVATWGLEKGNGPNCLPLGQALDRNLILLPLPVCRGGELNLPLTDTALSAEQLWKRLRYDQLLLGGQTKELSPRLMADYGLTLLDYYAREETQIANAVPTAEGAIQRAMEATERTLHGSRCLIIGFGRIGKMLSRRLQGLGAQVEVFARKFSDQAWVEASGYQPFRFTARGLEKFDLIFNTAPALVLDAGRLAEIREDCVLLELASPPGGVDLEAAQRLGRRVIRAAGLPGEVAPVTAASAIRDSIYHILEERGEPI